MSCVKSFLNILPLSLLLAITCWLTYAYLVEFCFGYIQGDAKKYTYVVVFNVLLVMFVWAYLQSWCSLGNSIPPDYKMSSSDHVKLCSYDDETMDQILRKIIEIRRLRIYSRTEMGRIRYCTKCMLLKPDRTHHCSSCKACILKMDHHCPWIANCVSFNNHKQFILMLFYATVLCTFYSGTMLEFVVQYWQVVQTQYDKLHLTLGFVVVTFAGLLVFVLFIFNVNMALKNETTLESMREPVLTNPDLTFNLGKWDNFLQVFGENPCCWMLPVNTALGNGYEFPVKNSRNYLS